MSKFVRLPHKPVSNKDSKAFDIHIVYEIDGGKGNIGNDTWISLAECHIYSDEEIKQFLIASIEGI